MSINTHPFVWPTTFSCTLVTEKIVIPNAYSINISIEPISKNPGDMSLGFKKIRLFVDNFLQNSIFIHSEHELVGSLSSLDTNLVILPTDPYDYFVGGVLYSKFLAITEKYFHVDLLTIDSAIGDNIQYTITHPDECGLELDGNFWWNMDTADTGLNKSPAWGDMLDIKDSLGFEPRIIKGGRSET